MITSNVAVSPSTTLNRAIRSSGDVGTGLRAVVVDGAVADEVVGAPAACVPGSLGASHTAPATRPTTATTVAATG
ncbi:hypothetical protein, partial [Saccharothrix hoggarensis]